MADDLSDSLDSLRYLVARPGTFAAFYPETTDDMLLQVLMDGMGEAQLMGLLLDYTNDGDGFVAPDMNAAQISMIVLFAAVRFMRAELLNRPVTVIYKAGSADYETTQGVQILNSILAGLQAQKDAVIALLAQGGTASAAAAFYMADAYVANLICNPLLPFLANPIAPPVVW